MNNGNKIVTLILLLSFLLSSIALATIEKDKTKKTSNDNGQNIKPGDSAGLLPDSGITPERPQGYDDFIDKNNNGIDDRVEKKSGVLKKQITQDGSKPRSTDSRKQNKDSNRLQRSPDDTIVKLKNR